MSSVLLDTNALIWFLNGDQIDAAALVAIADAQSSHGIFVSPISAWEAALAVQKLHRQPDLGGRDAAEWFRAVLKVPGTKLVRPGSKIAIEAAKVPSICGHGDPGDCFIIATARVKKLPVVTRDGRMQRLAARRPDYLQTISC
jgi:PIN domain nuclease of toxin-antitoxin system